jgi:hypothetical protein
VTPEAPLFVTRFTSAIGAITPVTSTVGRATWVMPPVDLSGCTTVPTGAPTGAIGPDAS